jgi:hypothetical protein
MAPPRWFVALAVTFLCLHLVCAIPRPAPPGDDDDDAYSDNDDDNARQNRARGKLNLRPNTGAFTRARLSGSGRSRSATIALPNGQTVNIQVEIMCVRLRSVRLGVIAHAPFFFR